MHVCILPHTRRHLAVARNTHRHLPVACNIELAVSLSRHALQAGVIAVRRCSNYSLPESLLAVWIPCQFHNHLLRAERPPELTGRAPSLHGSQR